MTDNHLSVLFASERQEHFLVDENVLLRRIHTPIQVGCPICGNAAGRCKSDFGGNLR